MAAPLRPSIAVLVALAAFLISGAARAQVHWDVGADVGAMKRFTTGGDVAAPNPGFGPVFELQSHVALVPMLRVGAYFAQDISPASNVGTRTFWEGGLHLKAMPPVLPSPWRTWAFVGFGYAYTYEGSYHAPVAMGARTTSVLFGGAYGGMLEVPLGIALGYRLRGALSPWLAFLQLGGRLGVGFYGPMYDDGAAGIVADTVAVAPFMGKDSFALTLCVGLSLEQ